MSNRSFEKERILAVQAIGTPSCPVFPDYLDVTTGFRSEGEMFETLFRSDKHLIITDGAQKIMEKIGILHGVICTRRIFFRTGVEMGCRTVWRENKRMILWGHVAEKMKEQCFGFCTITTSIALALAGLPPKKCRSSLVPFMGGADVVIDGLQAKYILRLRRNQNFPQGDLYLGTMPWHSDLCFLESTVFAFETE